MNSGKPMRASPLSRAQILGRVLPNSLYIFRKRSLGNTLYLTFDDGPHPEVTPRLLDLLAAEKVSATFFCIGKNVEAQPEIARRIHAEGHVLANHSYGHPSFHKLDLAEQLAEFERTEHLLRDITGQERHLFRSPYGHWNARLMLRLAARRVVCAHWSLDSLDCLHEPVDLLVARLQGQALSPGEVLLFHDDNDLCHEALAQLLPFWREQGHGFSAL